MCIICRNKELRWETRYGPILLRKYLYGKTWMWLFTSDKAKTDHLVEVYRCRRHFCRLATRWGELAGLFDRIKFVSSNDKVHRRVVKGVCYVPGHKSDTWLGISLVTDLYTKQTDNDQYLHQWSCHPSPCKSSIAYSQALWTCKEFVPDPRITNDTWKNLKKIWSRGQRSR